MPAAYILKSQSTGKFYIGSALDLTERLAEHHRGHSPYTRNLGYWLLAYSDHYATLSETRQRERQIKSWKSRNAMQELIDTAVGSSVPSTGLLFPSLGIASNSPLPTLSSKMASCLSRCPGPAVIGPNRKLSSAVPGGLTSVMHTKGNSRRDRLIG
jgi:putative endonuclease